MKVKVFVNKKSLTALKFLKERQLSKQKFNTSVILSLNSHKTCNEYQITISFKKEQSDEKH